MPNTDEVIDLSATALTGAVRLTWGVSSINYLESFLIVVEQNGRLVEKITVGAGEREVTIACEGTGWTFNVQAIVAQGGKLVKWDPLPVKPPAPPAPPSSLQVGLVLNEDTTSALTKAGVAAVGAKLLRSGFISSAAQITALQAAYPGVEIQPLIESAIPTPATAASYIDLAVAGVELIEFLNETNYDPSLNTKAGGETYGRSAATLAEALKPKGVGLLVQGSDAGSGHPSFLEGIFAAVPHIASLIAGWTIHPYWGANSATDAGTDTWGVPMMQRMVAALEAHGDHTVPIYATEDGISSTNGGALSSKPWRLTYAEAATVIARRPAELQTAAKGRLAQWCCYCGHDLAAVGSSKAWEDFFGVVNSAGATKGTYTAAVKALMD